MELLYDLKGHMEQLQREMSELRKSIQSCMEMQMNSQNYLKVQEVHPVQGNGKNSFDRRLNKRSCCICYETQVDSFLYRCGHMCTCLKCAHELLQSSGKCPICRAPILDVVRAYLDS
nr:unknown [Populus trichocarpa]